MKQLCTLGTFLTEYKEKNKENKYKPVAVGRYGIRKRESIYSKELAKDYSKNKLIFKNTLTVGMGSTQIDIGILTDDIICSVSPAYHTYRVNGINATYLRYCLECRNQDMFVRFVKRGSRQGKTIDLKRWLKYEIPVWNAEMQIEIANKLDYISNLIIARNEQIALFDELVKSRFIELFGNPEDDWEEVKIADICTDMRTGPFGSALHHDEFVDSGIFVLGIDNAVENRFSYNRMRYITEEKYERLKRYTVHPGDVIITIMGTVGRSAVIPEDMPKAINTKHLACLTPNTSIVDSYFLTNAFQIHPAIRQQLECQSKGAIMDGLNLTVIKGVIFRLPPLNLQKKFVAFYNQVDKSKYRRYKSGKLLQKAAII